MEDFKVYNVEDPPEVYIGGCSSMPIFRSNPSAPPVEVNFTEGWRFDGLLEKLGSVVAYEREDGSMALSTWDGDSVSVWAKFDVSPIPSLIYMRRHMVDAISFDEPRPLGYIKVICFTREEGYRPKA